jgi:uncharacterized protein YndB with AHSA1/START domain
MTATAKASRVIAAEPAEVWETLTSREGMKAYMMGAEVETDWRVGGPIAMRGEFKGKPYVDRGEVRSFEPRRRLSYTHTSSAAPDQTHVVTIELKPRKAGTEVTITQENADGAVKPTDLWHRAEYDQTWAAMLEKLEEAVAL